MSQTRESIVAVIGLCQGPWVFTGRLPAPVLEVHGSERHVVSVELAHEPREDSCFQRLVVDGVRQVLDAASYVRVHYLAGPAKMPICRINSR